jgi:hypothetical protein
MNRYTITIILFFFVLVAASTAHAAWYKPVEIRNIKGVLVESTAPVNFTSKKGTEISAVVGTELKPGTVIKAGEDGSAKIMLMNGELVEVAENTSYIVGAAHAQEEKKSMMKGLTVALNEAAKIKIPLTIEDVIEPHADELQQQPRIHGMVKMGSMRPTPKEQAARKKRAPKKRVSKPRLEGIFPVETTIVMPKQITFRWSQKLYFTKPVVTFKGPDNLYKRFDIDPKSPKRLTVSAKDLGLQKGIKYSWFLASRNDKAGKGRSRRYNFTVMSDQQEKSLKKDLSNIDKTASTEDGRAFLTAQLYFNHGMMHDMVQTLLPLWNKNKTPAIKDLLKLGYYRMGITSEAKKYR